MKLINNIYIFSKILFHSFIFLLNPKSFKEYQFAPFDILKPLHTTAGDKLKDLLRYFENCSDIEVRISDGSLLGILRDGKLIEHDNDIDFDLVWSKRSEKIIKKLSQDKNWKLIRKVTYKGRIQQLSYYDDLEIIYDFIFWSLDERFAINFSEPHCYRIMKEEFLTKLVKENIEGFDYLVPQAKLEWLNYRYGKNWKFPENSKKDWKIDCGDLGKAWWL